MSRRDPDSAAGVYVALVAATMLVCLIGALVLPPSVSLNKWLGLPAVVGFFIGVPWLNRLAHRSRIREAVTEIGGSVVCIKRLPFWQQFWQGQPYLRLTGVRHEVDYLDATGSLHRALCYSSWFIGVEWLEDMIVNS